MTQTTTRAVWLAFLLAATSVACSVTDMLPKGPVVDEATRGAVWREDSPSGVEYTSGPQVEMPAVPFLVFGLRYDLDIVLVSDHPKWEMHEYARIEGPDGPIWLAKDTRASNGDQLLVADRAALEDALPEIPLSRKSTGLDVDDQSSGSMLDLRFRYENVDGAPVDVRYQGPHPETRLSRRNGSTMGHSRHQVMAVLDLPYRDFASAASISIGDRPYGIQRAVGIKPMQLALRQTQGGIPEARVEWSSEDANTESPSESFLSRHLLPDGTAISRRWRTHRTSDRLVVWQNDNLRTLIYRFRIGADEILELTSATVRSWDDDRTFHIDISPALPDLRRTFRGTHRSRFVMDVGGQRNHAIGTLEVTSDGDRATVAVRGTDPWWVADRCVDSVLEWGPGAGIKMQTDIEPCR